MDDLMEYLYAFLLEHRMGHLWKDENYKTYNSAVKLQRERLESCLTEAQKEELELLLEYVAMRDAFAQERFFQAVLELVRELSGLVRA